MPLVPVVWCRSIASARDARGGSVPPEASVDRPQILLFHARASLRVKYRAHRYCLFRSVARIRLDHKCGRSRSLDPVQTSILVGTAIWKTCEPHGSSLRAVASRWPNPGFDSRPSASKAGAKRAFRASGIASRPRRFIHPRTSPGSRGLRSFAVSPDRRIAKSTRPSGWSRIGRALFEDR